jgi:hypothetical protein
MCISLGHESGKLKTGGTYLPTSFNAVEVTGEGAGKEPHLGEAELAGHLDAGTPNVHGALGSVVHLPLHVADGMLHFSHHPQLALSLKNPSLSELASCTCLLFFFFLAQIERSTCLLSVIITSWPLLDMLWGRLGWGTEAKPSFFLW